MKMKQLNWQIFIILILNQGSNLRFENCELMGPAMIAADGCTFFQEVSMIARLLLFDQIGPLRAQRYSDSVILLTVNSIGLLGL
jgi:hypothetical protein